MSYSRKDFHDTSCDDPPFRQLVNALETLGSAVSPKKLGSATENIVSYNQAQAEARLCKREELKCKRHEVEDQKSLRVEDQVPV